MPSFRVIGPGRVGKALTDALIEIGWLFKGFLGRSDDCASAAKEVDLLVIATPDQEIAKVARVVKPENKNVVIHLSGILDLDVLEPHPRSGSLHPLLSIPGTKEDGENLRNGVWFAVSGDPLVEKIVKNLGGKILAVSKEDRVAYHAAAVISSNHLVALMGQVEEIAAKIDLPLEPFLQLAFETLKNISDLNPQAALTGPASRGDERTLTMHIDVLTDEQKEIYKVLSNEARRLSER